MSKENVSPESTAQPMAVSIRATQLLTGLGRSSIYKLLGDGRLRARHFGRRVLVLRTSIDEFLASLPEAKFKLPPKGRA
jgi:excisionase family DNA binding protein